MGDISNNLNGDFSGGYVLQDVFHEVYDGYLRPAFEVRKSQGFVAVGFASVDAEDSVIVLLDAAADDRKSIVVNLLEGTGDLTYSPA